MPGISRAWARAWVLLFSVLLAVAPAIAGDSQVRPDCTTILSAQTVGTSTSVTSSAFVQLGQAKDISLQVQATGTSPNYTVSVLTSLDESTYVAPETGATLGTFTDGAAHIVAISVPFCKGIKVVVLNNSGANTFTVTGTLCSQ